MVERSEAPRCDCDFWGWRGGYEHLHPLLEVCSSMLRYSNLCAKGGELWGTFQCVELSGWPSFSSCRRMGAMK
jgi:hypothetical protein